MSENLETEITFEDLIDAALAQDYNKANEIFNAAISAKQDSVLDQERIKVAGQIFNGEDEDVYPEEDDLEDVEDMDDVDDDQEDFDVDDDEEDIEDDIPSEVEK